MYSEQPESPRPAIALQGAGKRYVLYARPYQRMLHSLAGRFYRPGQEFWALRDVSFELAPGTTMGIVGVNGSGKSTLLQLIAGTLAPSAGSVRTHGRIAALLELGAGFNPELSGRDNVRLTASLYGLDAKQTEEKLPKIEAFAEIGHFMEQAVKLYSSGMFVRLAFSVIAHIDADILIVDEALAVGDAYFSQKCMRFLHAFREKGTVLFVSHDMASIKSLASEVLWLQDGCVVDKGSAKAIGDAYLKSQYARAQVVNAPQARMTRLSGEPVQAADTAVADVREPVIKALNLTNHIQVFQFKPDDPGFGAGLASIQQVSLHDGTGQSLVATQGGERVTLAITALANDPIESPIVGFFLRNRLGLNVFGDNTYLIHRAEPLRFASGAVFVARFEFLMPYLPRGEYAFCAAVATGSNQDHVQQHWVNEALLLTSLSSEVHADVMGLPMLAIGIEAQ